MNQPHLLPGGADTTYKLSNYLVIVDGDPISAPSSQFILTTRNGLVSKVSSTEGKALRLGQFWKIGANRIEDFLLAGIIVKFGCDELVEVISENITEAESSQELYLPFLPSNSCQLGCSYCGQSHNKSDASPELKSQLLNYIEANIASNHVKNVRLGIFGAEPLLGYRWLLDFSKDFRLVKERHPEISFSAKIISNGISATKEKVQILVTEIGLDTIEITLDGPRDIHNIQRASKNGRDYFDRIVDNICKLGEIDGLSVILRTNVTSLSYRHIPDFIDYLTSKGINKFAQAYFAPVHSWGNSANMMAMDSEKYSYHELLWKIQLLDLGWKVGLIPSRKKITCLSMRKDGIIVDAAGHIYDCSEMPLVVEYSDKSIGHISQSALSRSERNFANFNQQIIDKTLPCSTCFALPVCGGACPKEWAEGRHPCPSFKNNAEYALRAFVNL